MSVVLLDTELKSEDNAAQSVGGSAGYLIKKTRIMLHKVSVVLLDTEFKKTRIMLHKVSVVLLDTEF